MGDHDLAIVSNIIIFLSSVSFLNFILPVAMQFITITSLAVFGLSVAGVAGFCVVATGIPCAIALGVGVGVNFAVSSGLISALGFTATSTYSWIGSIILTPLSLILSVFIAKLARGQ